MVLWRAGILLVIVWLSGCGTGISVPQDDAAVQSAIIVVPGYYGTKLAEVSDGNDVWLDAWEALFGRRSLRLPLPSLGFDGGADLRPHGILKQINVIPLIYSVEGYGSLLDALRESRLSSAQVVPFPYDWRLDLMEAVQELGNVVDRLRGQGYDRIVIVAHSMGGLIAGYYLRYGTQDSASAMENWEGAAKVDAVVMAGVPFRGSMTQFRNAQYGVQIGLNRSLLDQKAVASFPATYYLLPVAEADVLLTPAHEPMTGMIRDGSNWKEYGWGLLQDSGSLPPDIVDRRFAYSSRWLREASRFSELLLAPSGVANPALAPLLYIFGKGYPTMARGVWLRHDPSHPPITERHFTPPPQACQDRLSFRGTRSFPGTSPNRLLFDEEHFKKYLPSADPDMVLQDGDRSVTVQSSTLPQAYVSAFRVTVKSHSVSHAELASAPEVLDEIVDFLAMRRTPAGRVQ